MSFVSLSEVQGKNCANVYWAPTTCQKQELSQHSFAPLTVVICCSVLLQGMETSQGMETGMSLKPRKTEPRADSPLFFFSFGSHVIVLILILSYLFISKLSFFLPGFLCSSLLCSGTKSCANPIHSPRACSTHPPTLGRELLFLDEILCGTSVVSDH